MVQAVNKPGASIALWSGEALGLVELRPLGERDTDPFENVMAAEDPPQKNAHTILYPTSKHAQSP